MAPGAEVGDDVVLELGLAGGAQPADRLLERRRGRRGRARSSASSSACRGHGDVGLLDPVELPRELGDRLDAPVADGVADRADDMGGCLDVEVRARHGGAVVVGRAPRPRRSIRLIMGPILVWRRVASGGAVCRGTSGGRSRVAGVSDSLPMFPLNAVLFPGVSVPLKVFEDRYRALVHHLLRVRGPDGSGVRLGRRSARATRWATTAPSPCSGWAAGSS